MSSTLSPSILLTIAASSLIFFSGCSDKDDEAQGACEKLLACCESLAPALQSQCQQTYDQWHQASGAEEQCQQALDVIASHCSVESPADSGAVGPRRDGGAADDENTNALCSDYIDNDGDGYTDCEDFSCSKNPSVTFCQGREENTDALCADGRDNDGNGFVDCEDFGCSRNAAVSVCGAEDSDALCSDGVDNDSNGFTDCEDFGCSRNPAVSVCGGVTPSAGGVDRQACTGSANSSGSLSSGTPVVRSGQVLEDSSSGGLKLVLMPEPFVEGSLVIVLYVNPIAGQLSYPPTSGLNGCALLRYGSGGWEVLDKSQLCEYSFTELTLASTDGVCDGTLTGVYMGVFSGNQTLSGSFHLPTDIPGSAVSEPSCRPTDSPCTSNSQCCSQSCAPAWGLCY